MKANYHTHTARCHHATGTEREYIECAIRSGMNTLGFSDHAPYPFGGGYVSRIRMLPEELNDYCSTIQSLREEYQDRIQLHIGLEAEYFPDLFPEFLNMLKDYPIEYLILGQHYIPSEPGIYSGSQTSDTHILELYCRQCMEAMQTGLYTYFAHPDLINYQGNPAVYKAAMTELVSEAISCGVPAEINILGIADGKHYPNRLFLEVLAETNCPVILGCDAHTPEFLLPTRERSIAENYIREYGLKLLEKVDLRPLR